MKIKIKRHNNKYKEKIIIQMRLKNNKNTVIINK